MSENNGWPKYKTLRDDFAGRAMQGAISGDAYFPFIPAGADRALQQRLVAEWAYDFADAMAVARRRHPEG